MDAKLAGRILVVDDQPNWRRALTKLLTKDGHTVATATSFEEAEAALSRDQFDVVILDVRLVDQDIMNVQGLELLQKAKAQARAPKVIMITGYPESIFPGVLARLGASALVLKVPQGATFDSPGFLKQVQELLQPSGASPAKAHERRE